MRKILKAIVIKIIISWYKLTGPLRILNFPTGFNYKILKALGAKLGNNVLICSPITFHGSKSTFKNLKVGDNSLMNGNNFLDLSEKITLEKGVSLGPGVIIMTHNAYNFNEYLESRLPHTVGKKEVIIKEGSGIKAGALITMGVTIGENSVIAGNAVVNRDVPPRVMVAGIPAKVIKEII